eukprot:6175609-Pleurochrysis_carterae.AAC.3
MKTLRSVRKKGRQGPRLHQWLRTGDDDVVPKDEVALEAGNHLGGAGIVWAHKDAAPRLEGVVLPAELAGHVELQLVQPQPRKVGRSVQLPVHGISKDREGRLLKCMHLMWRCLCRYALESIVYRRKESKFASEYASKWLQTRLRSIRDELVVNQTMPAAQHVYFNCLLGISSRGFVQMGERSVAACREPVSEARCRVSILFGRG